MEVKGKIVSLLPLQSGNSKNGPWKKQEFILETLTQYPKKICMNLWGDKIDQFNVSEEDIVTAHIDIESREYNGRWYTDVRVWKLDSDQAQAQMPEPQAPPPAEAPPQETAPEEDDLPF